MVLSVARPTVCKTPTVEMGTGSVWFCVVFFDGKIGLFFCVEKRFLVVFAEFLVLGSFAVFASVFFCLRVSLVAGFSVRSDLCFKV